ncbi:MAG: hypothetical protein LQ340_002446 [Diploschistes diacapsis]|nr:MAG: hypothetical protein LQ340_002446 [Diploschistes diacapsis]
MGGTEYLETSGVGQSSDVPWQFSGVKDDIGPWASICGIPNPPFALSPSATPPSVKVSSIRGYHLRAQLLDIETPFPVLPTSQTLHIS